MSSICSRIRSNTAGRVFLELLPYLVITLICFVALYHNYDLGEINISYPFSYSGDGIAMNSLIKGMSETGSWWSNPRLGGQYGQSLIAYPYFDALSLYMIYAISLFTDNPFLIFNLFLFLTFFLCGYTAYFALRQFEVHPVVAVLCAVLFTFLPYHMLRYVHLLLCAYFMVPLVIMVVIWVLDGSCSYERKRGESRLQAVFGNRKLTAALVICLLASSTGLYYTFFSCFFLVAAWIMLVFRRNKGDRIPLLPLVLIGVFALGIFLNYLPNLVYAFITGESGTTQTAVRSPHDAELYALTLVTLILPQSAHRSELLRSITERYTGASLYVNENTTAALGIIGAIGLLILLFLLFRRRKHTDGPALTRLMDLSTLCVAGVFLGAIGGLGTLIAYVLNSGVIRGYCRISVFIGFFALAAVALICTSLYEKVRQRPWAKPCAILIACALLVFGLWDQAFTFYHSSDEQNEIIDNVDSDREFIQNIEAQEESGALVFELPYSSYPWGPEYPLLKGFVYSDDLVWSFGGVLGSNADLWAREVSSLPPEQMVDRLQAEGYCGIYIDKTVYQAMNTPMDRDVTKPAQAGTDGVETDYSKEICDSLTEILGPPQISSDGTLLFYAFPED